MKNKYLLLFCVLVTSFAGCRKEPIKFSQIQIEKLPSRPVAVIYVDSSTVKKILGNTLKENEFLEWCQKEEFNELILYYVGKILGNDVTKIQQLNNFVGKAHRSGLKVSFVASSSAGVNKIGTYHANYTNKPDGIVTEYEFWNKGHSSIPNSFATFKGILDTLTKVHKNTAPSVGRAAYVYKFKDFATPNQRTEIIQYLIKNCDTIFIANYYTNAYNLSTELRDNLQYIANEAKRLNKVANIIIIFNVNKASATPDIYRYFSRWGFNHKFIDAYNNLINDYNKSSITNKARLKIKGYAIYRYSDARLARPLTFSGGS